MTEPPEHLRQSIGVLGASALVIGGVIGAGIYTLVGPIAANSGGAIWLAFALGMAVSVAGVVPVMQLAVALPRAGAGYFFASRLIAPLAGTVASTWILLGGACSVCVVSLGLAQYISAYDVFGGFPGGAYGMAIALVLMFYVVYLFGVHFAMGLQAVMALQMVLALVCYDAVGLSAHRPDLGWTSPAGGGAFFLAIVLAYNCCMGLTILAEMAEEIRHPRRTIPLALAIGCIAIAVIYIATGVVFIGTIPYDAVGYKALPAPISTSAAVFLSPWAVAFVNFGAITAGLTSLNAALVALPREIFAQARDGMLPSRLGHVDGRTGSPLNAVSLFTAGVLTFLAAGLVLHISIETYSYLTVVGIQVATSAICISALPLKRRFPSAYAKASIHVPAWLLWSTTVFTVLASAGLVALMGSESPPVLVVYGLVTVAAVLWHVLRCRALKRRGDDLAARVRAFTDGA